MEHSESITKIAAALVKVAGEIEDPRKTGENPHYGNRYADLTEVVNTARAALHKNGIALMQSPGMEDGLCTVETFLLHESGEWIRGTACSPLSKQDPQGVGSATTYLRRYSLLSLLGLGQQDDDGEGAVDRSKKENGAGRPSPELVEATQALLDLAAYQGAVDVDQSAKVEAALASGNAERITNAKEWLKKAIPSEQREETT